MAKISILHISDLHRDASQPISNDALIDSIQRDLDHYPTHRPPIPNPNFIVVSGDLVQGVGPLALNPEKALEYQYSQAESLLVGLADRLLGGHREHVVVVPGNHDVSFPKVAQSLRKVVLHSDPQEEADQVEKLVQQLGEGQSTIRWDWRDLSFFEIADAEKYQQRFAHYAQFVERFYSGSVKFHEAPDKQFWVHDFPEYDLTITAFSSCFNNDPLRRAGMIKAECISAANEFHRTSQLEQRVRMAVWHHPLSGPPVQSDYIDVDVMKVLIDSGYSICLHGHQHRPDVISQQLSFLSGQSAIVVSAGSLCAGREGLPTGQMRSYNIVTLDTQTGSGRVFVREVMNNSYDCALWKPGRIGYDNDSSLPFKCNVPAIRKSTTSILDEAQALIHAKKYTPAAGILKPLVENNTLARVMYLECLNATEDHPAVIDVFAPPQSVAEWISVYSAAKALHADAMLASLVGEWATPYISDAQVAELIGKYKARKRL